MGNILDRIVVDIKEKIEISKKRVPLNKLEESPLFSRETISVVKAFQMPEASGVIAEFKRRSPSKGIINGEADVVEVTRGYQAAGASAVSILTNETFFGGCNEYLTAAREHLTIPIIRKEFIVDKYQITEAKAIGADFILLIAEILTATQVEDFTNYAHSLGLEVLMELHGEDQLSKINSHLDLIGINNRNLKNFEVDIERSIAMAKSLPSSTIKVAESGLSDPQVALKMRENGFSAFLVGEQFMKQEDPALGCQKFCEVLING